MIILQGGHAICGFHQELLRQYAVCYAALSSANSIFRGSSINKK